MKIRLRNRERSNGRKGRPTNIPMDLAPPERPENYPSLMRYLEASGKIKHVSYITMMKARHLFIRGGNTTAIAAELKVEPATLMRWITIFGWEELRDKMQFEAYRKISGLREKYTQNIGERHDRIAGSIEQVAEQMLNDVHNGKMQMTPKDLSVLAATVKSTQEIRRVVRGENIDKKENRVDINVNLPASMERLANAVLDAQIGPERMIAAPSKRIAVQIGEMIDSDDEYDAH